MRRPRFWCASSAEAGSDASGEHGGNAAGVDRPTPDAETRVAPLVVRTLYVPDAVLLDTWRAFQEGARCGVESTVRWAGPSALSRSAVQVVSTLLNPVQRVASGFFEIPHAGTRAMGAALARHQLVNVAQVHTHPERWVAHSRWDDEHAYSRREGALSIVWPSYGWELPPLDTWGVHERRGGVWARLDAETAAARIVVLPGAVHLRGPLELLRSASEHCSGEQGWDGADSDGVERGGVPADECERDSGRDSHAPR